MGSRREKKGLLERGAGLFERLNHAVGAAALTGAVILESAPLAVFGALQFAEGAIWNYLKNRSGRNKKVAQPTGRLALAAP